MEYRKVSDHDFRSGAGDEGYLSHGIFETLNPNYQTRLLELIIETHGSDKIEKSYDREFYNEYNSYVKLYTDVIDGENPAYYVEKEIFGVLAKEGYINNGLLKTEYYYKTKYNDYYVSNCCYEHVIDDTETYYTKDEIFDRLLESKKIVEVAPNTYKYIPR